jgi:nucleotide-binding universal stress UspA family protein
MYQRIVVATDGSDTSNIAVEHAVQLAKDQRARLRIVHVIESIGYAVSMAGAYPFDPTPLWEALREGGRQALSTAEAKARSAGVEIETALLEDKEPPERVASILAKDAQKWDADLIVLGTHGRRGVDRLFLGSVAETLVRMASTPVLLVRAKTKAH